MYDYDDFYNEPSELEMQVDEFKESLLNAVKDEYKAEMERLRKENAELLEIKKSFDQIKRDYNQKMVELDMAKRDLKNEVRKERLKDILKDFEVLLYRPTHNYEYGPKCNNCDENRQIHYKTPSGKDAQENCGCKEKHKVFKSEEFICKSFANRSGKFIAWYTENSNDEDSFGIYSNAPQFIYAGEEFKDINLKHWEVFFKTPEECQAYCAWLTAKEGQEENG